MRVRPGRAAACHAGAMSARVLLLAPSPVGEGRGGAGELRELVRQVLAWRSGQAAPGSPAADSGRARRCLAVFRRVSRRLALREWPLGPLGGP